MIEREKVQELMETMMQVARLIRERCGYSEAKETFMPVAIVVGGNEGVQVVATPHRNAAEKHVVMQTVAEIARDVQSPLVVLVQDARAVKPVEFGQYYGLPLPGDKTVDVEEYTRRYHEVLRQHDGCLGNCHPSTWQDVLMVVSKSPVMPIQMRHLRYREGVGDTVVWQKEEVMEDGQGGLQLWLKMLPDWWKEETTQLQ